VLLVTVAGIAQAAHIHGEWLPNLAIQIAAHTSLPPGTGEDACPLCTAMHSALPVASFSSLIVRLVLDIDLLLASTRKAESFWYFAAFSRPPPSLIP
jgi:hypothetical protein